MAGGWPEQKPADAVAGLSANGAAFPKPSSADPTTSFNQPLDGAAFTSGMGGLDWVGLPEVLERLGPRCWERRLVSRRSLFLRFQAPLWPTGPGLRRCFGRWRGGCPILPPRAVSRKETSRGAMRLVICQALHQGGEFPPHHPTEEPEEAKDAPGAAQ